MTSELRVFGLCDFMNVRNGLFSCLCVEEASAMFTCDNFPNPPLVVSLCIFKVQLVSYFNAMLAGHGFSFCRLFVLTIYTGLEPLPGWQLVYKLLVSIKFHLKGGLAG